MIRIEDILETPDLPNQPAGLVWGRLGSRGITHEPALCDHRELNSEGLIAVGV